MSYPWIRASEISEYVYCRRSWWLKRVQGLKPRDRRALRAGSGYHRQHGGLVRRVVWLRRIAYLLIFVAVAFIVFQVLGVG